MEVGSNSGEDTLRLLEAFPESRVMAFEPDPRAAARWRQNVKNSRASLHECVVSSEQGTVQFFQSEGIPPDEQLFTDVKDWDLSGSIRRPAAHRQVHPWVKFRDPISVPSVTLDSFCASIGLFEGHNEVALIWVDVQGAEADVIAGGHETLRRTRYFYTEFSNDYLYEGQVNLKELAKLLPNFRISRIWKNDVLFENVRL